LTSALYTEKRTMKTIEQTINEIEKRGEAIGFDQKSDYRLGALLSTLCASKPNGAFLELGTGCGLSAVWMAKGMDAGSTLVTVDNDTDAISIAREYLGDDPRIKLVCESGESVIDEMQAATIDLIFADTWAGKYHYFNEAWALLKVGGIYVIDDMLPQDNWPEGHEMKVESLVESLRERDDVCMSQLDWASGVIIVTKTQHKETNHWNPDTYSRHTSFVSELALPVVDLLSPQSGELILDAGCGDGTLAREIQQRGAEVIGIDMSAEMVTAARANGIEAQVASVTDLPFVGKFDAVFSNAMLHWVQDAKSAAVQIAQSLKPGGRFVAEFGGEGNAYHLVSAMEHVFAAHPEWGAFENPWYFPSIEAYTALLKSAGFSVETIELIPRPTPMDDIMHWLDIFTNGVTEHLDRGQFEMFKVECREILRPMLYTEEQGWVLDYVRLRVKAVKIG